jgi:hypothetical protein
MLKIRLELEYVLTTMLLLQEVYIHYMHFAFHTFVRFLFLCATIEDKQLICLSDKMWLLCTSHSHTGPSFVSAGNGAGSYPKIGRGQKIDSSVRLSKGNAGANFAARH